jgi:hypothetical protein
LTKAQRNRFKTKTIISNALIKGNNNNKKKKGWGGDM